MKIHRRQVLHLGAASAALSLTSRAARADDYPSRPVRIFVGFGAGMAVDIVARLIAASLSDRLGQPVVVENHPGAATNFAAGEVVRAAPDGYTLLAMTVNNAVNATLYKNLKFNIMTDLTPIAATFRSPNVLVVTLSLPVKTLPEFIAYAKAHPGKINCATGGPGSAPYMAAELFKMMTGLDLVNIPYTGNYVPDLLSGQVQCAFPVMAGAIANIRAGKLRALAVTSAERSDALPDVPPVAEFVPGFEASIWYGIGAPKNTPAAIINKLNNEINSVLADPKLKTRFADIGGVPMGGSPEAFRTLIANDVTKWANVIRVAKISPM